MKTDNNALIRIFRVSKHYTSKPALINITLDIFKNEFVFFSGPSGAGKSTLLKILYLGEEITEGQVLIDGMNIARIPRHGAHVLRRKIGVIFQDYKLIPGKTVYQNIALVLEAKGLSQRFIQKKVHSVLRTVGMENRKKSLPLSLSGGEQQKIAIARAIVGEPKIILADEPTGSLDVDAAAHVLELLTAFHNRGATILFATHDKDLIRNTKHRVILLDHGRIQS